MKKNFNQIKLIVVIVLVILAVILIIQNSGMVTFKIFFWKISMSRIIMMSLLLLVGFVLGLLAASPILKRK
jgi:uncharacterized integral membrane protein